MLVIYLDDVKEINKHYTFIKEKIGIPILICLGLSYLREIYKNNVEKLVDDIYYKNGQFKMTSVDEIFQKTND